MALQAEVEAVDDIVNGIVTSHEVPVRINLDNINVSDNIKEKIKSVREVVRLLISIKVLIFRMRI